MKVFDCPLAKCCCPSGTLAAMRHRAANGYGFHARNVR